MRRSENLIEKLMGAPWWISAILAITCFIAAAILPRFDTGIMQLGNSFSMLAKLLGFVFIFTGLISFIIGLFKGNILKGSILKRNIIKRNIFKFEMSLDEIKNLTWKEFEDFIGEYYRQMDYSVEMSRDGADGGIDLIARKNGEKIIVQCKHWQAFKVGDKILKELYGVMVDESASKAVLVTSGGFTTPALDWAEDKPIEMIDGRKLVKLISGVKKNKTKTEIKKPVRVGAPSCPHCNKQMELRTARKGSHPGQKFWGCKNYPRCTHTKSYEANKI